MAVCWQEHCVMSAGVMFMGMETSGRVRVRWYVVLSRGVVVARVMLSF